jgi:uncharacterized protein
MPATDAAPTTATAPRDATVRIATLDILRGFALFGMVLVHFHQRFRLSTTLDDLPGEPLVGWVIWLGAEQKAWGVFAFLFGAGFAILMRRAEAKGQPVRAFFLRRMAALAVIGLAVHVFTDFQILMEYALWGVILLALRNRSTRTLVIIAVVAAMAPWLVRLAQGLHELQLLGRAGADAAWEARQAAAPAMVEAQSYAQVVMQRLRSIPSYLAGLWLPSGSFPLFLLGLLAVRKGVFDDPLRHASLIRRATAFGLASWLAFWLILQRMPMEFSSARVVMPIRYGMGLISDQWLALTYVGALMLLLAYRPAWTGRLAPFGIAGRMALTNYVAQCVIIEILSSPFGLHLRLRPYYYALAAMALFAALVAMSALWLSRFRYGPLEWLWRSASYRRWQAIRVAPRDTSAIAAVGG